jgi:hypothetical protein
MPPKKKMSKSKSKSKSKPGDKVVISSKRSKSKHKVQSQSHSRSWGIRHTPAIKRSRATEKMNMTELQGMAKSLGFAFGGINKRDLVIKINRYM